MADTFAGIAVMPVDDLRERLGWHAYLDGRDDQPVSDFHHALRMVRLERNRYGGHQLPGRVSREFLHAFRNGRSGIRGKGSDGHRGGRKDYRIPQ